MKRYVKFYPSILKSIRKQMENSYAEEYSTLNYILYRLYKKDNNVIEVNIINELKKIAYFNVDDEIYCYLDKESDIIEAVRVRGIMFEILKSKINSSKTRKAWYLLKNTQNNIIMKTTLNRIEFLTGIPLEKYIIDTVIAPVGTVNSAILIDKKEVKDNIYKVARYLSNKHNYGYKIDYETSTLTVETTQRTLTFTWDRGVILLNGKLIANLLDNTKRIGEYIVFEFRKRMLDYSEVNNYAKKTR